MHSNTHAINPQKSNSFKQKLLKEGFKIKEISISSDISAKDVKLPRKLIEGRIQDVYCDFVTEIREADSNTAFFIKGFWNISSDPQFFIAEALFLDQNLDAKIFFITKQEEKSKIAYGLANRMIFIN